MKMLFCGTYMPLEFARKLKHSSEAALKFQRNLLSELIITNDIEVLSYIPYNDNKIYSLKDGEIENIKVTYIKKNKYKSYLKILIDYSKKMKLLLKDKEGIFLYNYSYINLFTSYIAKKNNVKSFLILADYDDYNSEKNILKKLLIKLYEKNIKKFDGVIFLSNELMNKMDINNKIMIEGGIQLDKYKDLGKPIIKENKIKIMYSGSLEKVSGVDIYLEAIKKINIKNIEFIFTGKGYLANEIKKQNDSRIIYKGMVSEEEYYKLLEQANILINCKNMNIMENRNNFPSKVLEYMASGRIIISTKFSGNEKFVKNILFTESNSKELAENIINLVNNYEKLYLSYYKLNIDKSKEFSWSNQVKKINSFIKNI
ncbi:glycosyltransferase [Clostridium perfringens]|uniref:glycosyltransferase n=1 Tax=Clostridium perfringens TaxID=1502 RepID=UPI0018E4390D|nr:glycosyltransferase [Clostridium perfringens]MBI6022007.1 glycosyltransferase [Clostridium perfringens]